MYDIVFLSYNEENADQNWENLKSRFPRAIRVDGVKGIVAAHQTAAARCKTRWFWVVDADNIIKDDFDFAFQWPNGTHKDTVGVWRAENNVNGLVYGYGGVKLLPRRKVLKIDPSVVDFTTSIGDQFRVMPETLSTTVIDGSRFEAWKAGFREAAKLASAVISRQRQLETDERLDTWCSKAKGEFGDEVIAGAIAGRVFGERNRGDTEKLALLNDFDWLKERFDNRGDITPTGSSSGDTNMGTDINSLLIHGLERMYPDKPFVRSFRQTVEEFPDARWEDSMSFGQMESKLWLVDELENCLFPDGFDREVLDEEGQKNYDWSIGKLKKVYLCASWYGILGEMILDRFTFDDIGGKKSLVGQIRGLDIDPDAVQISNRLLKHWDKDWQFKATVADIYDLNYDQDELTFVRHDGEEVTRVDHPSLIINTSCEHIENFSEWWDKIPFGTMVVVQSNDYFGHNEHVNCSEDYEAFSRQTKMKNLMYGGELRLNKYTRFMRIGRK